ncbi:MAG: META domain-containing protein [Actinomycetota bacterium]|nr:META domain-containing protein [Actinomycetota bacterium]
MVTRLEDDEGELTPVLEGTTLTLTYDGERISGNAGCNSYFGPASIDDTVQIGPLATTLMIRSEPAGVMEQERRFLDLLQGVDSIDVAENHLELGQGGGRVAITMIRMLTELTGSWSLLLYDNGNEAMVSPILETEITALFEDGRLRGHSGCNRYTTIYETEGDSLRIGAPAGTRMMCQQPDGVMAQEGRYLELLPTTDSYLIRDGHLLELFKGEGRILEFDKI